MHAEGKLRRRTQIEGPNLSQLLQQIREICRQWLLLSSKSLLCYHTFLTNIWKSSKSRITFPHKSPALPPQNPITTANQRKNSRLYRLADALINDKCGLRKHHNSLFCESIEMGHPKAGGISKAKFIFRPGKQWVRSTRTIRKRPRANKAALLRKNNEEGTQNFESKVKNEKAMPTKRASFRLKTNIEKAGKKTLPFREQRSVALSNSV